MSPSSTPAWVASQANTLAALHGWSPFIALQVEYSLIERTAERELLPVAEAFGLSVTARAPLGGGVLTGKYTRNSSGIPEDSKRAAGNQMRLTERNMQIAREVDRVAAGLGVTSAQVATAWVRQRGERIISTVGVRTLEQLQDLLGSLEVELSAEHLSHLDEVSRIELGFPHDLLCGPQGQLVYGVLEPQIDLPGTAPYRRQRVRAALAAPPRPVLAAGPRFRGERRRPAGDSTPGRRAGADAPCLESLCACRPGRVGGSGDIAE